MKSVFWLKLLKKAALFRDLACPCNFEVLHQDGVKKIARDIDNELSGIHGSICGIIP